MKPLREKFCEFMQLIFMTAYGTGLRLQELVNLKIKDIDIGTTMVYLHVTNRLISKVESPLEKIVIDTIDPFSSPSEADKKEQDND